MRRADQSKSSKAILRVTITLFILFGALLAYKALKPVPNCHDTPSEQVDIVFDKTKPYSPTQAHSVDRTLREILTRAADNAEINLYYITSNGDLPYLVISECRPSTRTNRLFGDPDEQQRTFQRLVVDKLKKKIDQHFGPRAAAPIVESLANISRERIVTSKIEQQTKVEFHIYSDMVQDSKNASLVQPAHGGDAAAGDTDPKRCTSTSAERSAAFKGLYTDVKQLFRDVPVHVYGIHREASAWPRYPGEQCVRTFWEETFPHLTWMTL